MNLGLQDGSTLKTLAGRKHDLQHADQAARSLKTHRQGNQGQYHIHRPMLVLEFAEVANMYIHVCKVE